MPLRVEEPAPAPAMVTGAVMVFRSPLDTEIVPAATLMVLFVQLAALALSIAVARVPMLFASHATAAPAGATPPTNAAAAEVATTAPIFVAAIAPAAPRRRLFFSAARRSARFR